MKNTKLYKDYLEFDYLNKFPIVKHAIGLKSLDSIESFTKHFGISNFIECEESHGNLVKAVGSSSELYLNGVDGLITQTKNLALVIRTADCATILLFDPVKKAIGAIHAGRKGTELNISENAIHAFVESYNSVPQDIVAIISHSICYNCYQIDRETDLHYNISGTNRAQLINAGLKPENVIESSICTICNSENKLWSFRRDKTDRRNYTYIALKP